MGVTHSRRDEWADDRLGERMRSSTMKSGAGNNNAANTYGDKPRSVSSNTVLLDGNRSNSAPPASSISTSSSLRSKMNVLRKPGPAFTRNSKTNGSGKCNVSQNISTNASDDANANIVGAFMTNMSSGGRNPANAFSNLPSNSLASAKESSETAATSGLRRPLVFRKGQQSIGISGTYVRSSATVLHIPSPVPSVTEPTPSEENVSMETVDNSEYDMQESGVPLRHVDSPSQTSPSRVVSGFVTKPCSTSRSAYFDGASFASTKQHPLSANIKTESPPTTSVKNERPSTSYGFNYARTIAPIGCSKSMNDSVLAGSEPGRAQTDVCLSTGEADDAEESVAVATAAGETAPTDAGCRLERPQSLLEKSYAGELALSWHGPRYYSSKLRYKGSAPLAESESFIVENSPAVELPPSATSSTSNGAVENAARNKSVSNNSDGMAKLNNSLDAVEPVAAVSAIGAMTMPPAGGTKIATAMGTRLQSRLKNPSSYEQRQRIIYGKYNSTTVMKNEHKLEAVTEANAETRLATPKMKMGLPSKLATPVSRQLSAADATAKTTGQTPKYELHDSGVKVDSCESGSSGSETTGSKVTSPEGSLNRGLIDDEIRDQPELTIGRSEGSVAEPHSQITTIQEEIPQQVEHSGPIRLRDRARKRSSTAGVNRMVESYDSTISSLSIDSEDLMIDYESLDIGDGEEPDLVGPTAGAESASLHSSLGRRSSASRPGAMGSLGRTRKSLAAGGKRASVDVVVSELASLKNETEKGSNYSQQRQRAFSDFPSPSSSAGGQYNQSPGHARVLRPPLSLECAGLSTFSLDQQAYRHMVQDVTVMKTLLLRLKRALQETETANPFESSLTLKNGLAKSALIEMEMQKNEERLAQLTKDDLKEENAALRTQIAVMRQQLEEQTRVVQCLQHQLKLCRQRSLRKSESTGDRSVPKDVDVDERHSTTVLPPGLDNHIGTVSTDL